VSRDVALVSADDFTAAVRVYADRVHDLLRRGGVGSADAVRIEEAEAVALLDTLVRRPGTVVDLAGWWFARALAAVEQDTGPQAPAAAGDATSVLAGTSGESGVRAALATLSTIERDAVLLRDAYDLPTSAVAVALGRDEPAARELVTAGRLHLVASYDDRRAPDLSGHIGRAVVDLVSLNGLADGSLESHPAALLRRHTGSCPACEDVVETLAKGRRLATALPIVAMPDEAREQLLDLVAGKAAKRLPSRQKLQRVLDSDRDPGPLVPPLLVVLAVAMAVALGLGLALLTHSSAS
jgi:DNA-directed RNA polymerase specialized sigma24 family protein